MVFSPQTPEKAAESHLHFPVETVIVGARQHRRRISQFGPNFITLTDEDGNEIELEYVDAIEVDGQTYMAFFPTVDDEADEAAAEEFGLVILKSITENGEELLSTLDSDEELNRVYDLFMEQLMDDEDGDN